MSDSQLLPALENICSKDDLRPVMGHVYLTKEIFVATDAHIMVWHDTDKFFDDKFIKEIPEEGILVHREDWAKMKKCAFLEWHKGMIKINYCKKRPVIIEVSDEKEVGKYPNWKAVVPTVDPENLVQLNQVALNPELLLRAQKAINYGESIIKLTFTGERRAILISEIEDKKGNYNGLIMPVMIN